MNPQQEALKATAELELTAKAFNELRMRYLDEIMGAKNAEEAWVAVLALRSLNSVTKSLQSILDTQKLEEHYEDES